MRESQARAHPPTPLLAMNASLAAVPHDAAIRRAMELLCAGSPILRTGSACNLACTYCCVGADGEPLQDEKRLKRLVDSLSALGHGGVGYMGGEPTIHPKFLELVRHARARGFRNQMLCTNGIRLAEASFADSLFEAGIDSVTTSLDAFQAEIQEPLYGGRSLHAQAMKGLHRALARPALGVLLSAVVTAKNAPLLAGYMDAVAVLQKRYKKSIGVMLCVLQQPAIKTPEKEALSLPLLEAARLVAKGLARAAKRGVPAFTFGFPPCLLGGKTRHVSELYASEWELDLDTGMAKRSRLHDDALVWAGCVACPHAGFCPGVMNQYASDEVREAVAERGAR